MMKHRKYSRRVTIFGLIGLIIAVTLLLWLSLAIFLSETSPSDEDQQPISGQGEQQDADRVATIGQKYIATLASYDQDQQQPILLIENEHLGGENYLVRYEVRQVFKDKTQMYFYSLTVQDDYVMEYHVSVSDRDRLLLITHPEPEQITTSKDFIVKGQLFNNEDYVITRLLNPESMEVLSEESIAVPADKDAVFSTKVQESLPEGELVVEIESGKSIVRSSFIYLPQKR